MSLILKNLNFCRKGFQFGNSYVNFVSRFVHQQAVNHNEQIEFMKTIIENKKSDWTEIKNGILCKSGLLNSKNIDAVMLKVLVTDKKFDMALSFAKYLKSSHNEISLGAINAILNLYYEYAKENKLSDDEKQFILDTHKSLYEKYKILDSTTCEKLLHALCSINEWKISIKVLDDINLTNTPSHSAYSFLIATLFKNNKRAEALKMIEKSVQNRRPLQDIAYDEWMKYILRKYNDKEILLKHLNEISQHISNNCAVVSAVTAQRLKESYESLNWNGNFTQIIQQSGKCMCCNQNLDCLTLSEEEFSILQKNVKEKLIVGSDLFLKTSPDELKRFLDFVNRTSPYDIVLDALNIAYSVGKSDIHNRIKVLGTVVDYFLQHKKRILLLGRKHMLKWRQIHNLTSRTESFFIDDMGAPIQQRDFLIMAAGRHLVNGTEPFVRESNTQLAGFYSIYPTLAAYVVEAIYTIYEDLSNKTLLEKCVGGFTQKIIIWKITPKIVPCGSKVVDIAAYIVAGMFNEGQKSLLYFMSALGLSLGTAAHAYGDKEDAERVMISDARAHGSTREGRMSRRQHQLDLLEATNTAEGTSYGPEIDNTISQDDPYFITAAILSGAHTDIVSRDLLRGHRFLMQKEQLKQLFQRWQWQHQWMVFVPSYKPVIQPPLKFTPNAQRNKSGWHLPYLSEKSSTVGQSNTGIPDCSSWLCLRQNSK